MVAILALTLASSQSKGITPLSNLDSLTGTEKSALKKAIGDARVVFLGELTHGDGSSFRYKVNLIKFLHQEMDFDGLIWESGLYDCAEMNPEIAGSRPIRQVASMGVFSHWSSGAESLPIFEYARSKSKTKRPLHMAGLDVQPSGSASNSQFPDMLSWFGTEPELTPEDRASIASSFKLVQTAGAASDPQTAFQKAHLAVNATSQRMLAAHNKNPEKFKKLWKDKYGLRFQVIQSATVFHRMLQLIDEEQPMFAGYNRRESANAINLKWLLNTQFKNKKVIVWAHNGHIFKGYPGLGAGNNIKATPEDLDSMGRIFANSNATKSYTLGFAAGGGTWSWLGNPTIKFQAPSPTAIESILKSYGHPQSFINFAELPSKHQLRKPLPGILDQQNPWPITTDWSQGYDGIIYINEMKPRTQLR